MKSNHTKLSYIERDFMGFIFRWPSSSLAIPPQQYTMMMIMTMTMMVMVAMIIMIVMTKQMVDLIWWWSGMPTAYFSGTFAPTTLLQVKAAIQGFSHVGLLYRNYSILLDIQSRFISRPNICYIYEKQGNQGYQIVPSSLSLSPYSGDQGSGLLT